MDKLTPGVYRAKQFIRKFHTTYKKLREAAADGAVTPLRHGWYATPGADNDLVAAVLAGGVLSCASALTKYGLWVAPGYDDDLHVRMGRHAEAKGHRCCHGFGDVPSTPEALDSLAVALACAARCMTEEHWIAAVDSALNKNLITITELERQWGIVPAWVAARLAKCDGKAQSGTESIVRVRLRALGFRVFTQVGIPTVGTVDLLVGRLIIECDSEDNHGSRPKRINDYRRDRKSLIRRWMVIRIDYEDVMERWPEILADIREITTADRHRRRSA